MHSFKVVSLLSQTAPPALWPLLQHGSAVLVDTDETQFVVKGFFQVLHSGKPPPLETSLDSGVHPKVVRGEVRGVGGVREHCPTQVGEVLSCEEGGMRRRVVKVQKSSALGGASRSSILESYVKSCDDLPKYNLVDCLWSPDEFSVHQAMTVKKSNHHHLACC